MKNKGFTLMELLAIIAIISIISIITISIVGNDIDDSKEKTAYESAFGVKRALETYYISFDFSGDVFNGYTCVFPDDCDEIELDGRKPSSGRVILDKRGNVSGYVKFDEYIYGISSDSVYRLDEIPAE